MGNSTTNSSAPTSQTEESLVAKGRREEEIGRGGVVLISVEECNENGVLSSSSGGGGNSLLMISSPFSKWECAMEGRNLEEEEKEEEEKEMTSEEQQMAKEKEEGEENKILENDEPTSLAEGSQLSSAEERRREQHREESPPLVKAGPLEVYHSNKVNHTNGQLFISALVRWEFSFAHFHDAYKIFLRVEEVAKDAEESAAAPPKKHLFSVLMRRTVPVTSSSSSSPFSSAESPRRIVPPATENFVGSGTTFHRLELVLRLDNLFQFGRSYRLKIISRPLHQKIDNNNIKLANAEKQAGNGQQKQQKMRSSEMNGRDEEEKDNEGQTRRSSINGPPVFAYKNVHFTKPPIETEVCRVDEDDEYQFTAEKRREFASHWTGALRSVVFFPLHAAINVSFFGAPPSVCIPGYRVQLWLLNTLQKEQIVPTDQLVREGPGIFVGAAEFREMFVGDPRLKYRIRLAPLERRRENGACVCELHSKCGCVQVFSDWFSMPNASSLPPITEQKFESPPITLLGMDAASKDGISVQEDFSSSSSSLFLLILAGLFLALTLVLLTAALVLLIMRRAGWAARKRRTLLIARREMDEGRGLMTSSPRSGGAQPVSSGSGGTGVYSVLLANAQPARSGDLERFARLLVKNGVRVFYDRWDSAAIERNLLLWVHQAITKADKAVFFWDGRAEKLLTPSVWSLQNGSSSQPSKNSSSSSSPPPSSTTKPTGLARGPEFSSLFDSVFCALHQQMNSEKAIFVSWDESAEGQCKKPLGCIGENRPFVFARDLALIYTALNVRASEQELREIQFRCNSAPPPLLTPGLAIVVSTAKRKNQFSGTSAQNMRNQKLRNEEEKEEEILREMKKNSRNDEKELSIQKQHPQQYDEQKEEIVSRTSPLLANNNKEAESASSGIASPKEGAAAAAAGNAADSKVPRQLDSGIDECFSSSSSSSFAVAGAMISSL